MRRFGIAVWNFPGDSLLAKVRSFADFGYDSISVQGDFLDSLTPSEAAQLAGSVAERDLLITVHSCFDFQERAVDLSAAVRQAERILSWHSRTGRIACLTYDIPWTEIRPNVWHQEVELVAKPFEEILRLTANSGIRVGLEDCPLYRDHLPELHLWLDRFPHYGTLIDLGHMNIRISRPDRLPLPNPPSNCNQYLERVPVNIIEIHVHNNDGTNDQHAPPYGGTCDMKEVGAALNHIGFAGVSTIEIVPGWCGLGEAESLSAAQKSLHYWKQCFDKSEASQSS